MNTFYIVPSPIGFSIRTPSRKLAFLETSAGWNIGMVELARSLLVRQQDVAYDDGWEAAEQKYEIEVDRRRINGA
jgi:hypothetical protein